MNHKNAFENILHFKKKLYTFPTGQWAFGVNWGHSPNYFLCKIFLNPSTWMVKLLNRFISIGSKQAIRMQGNK